MAALPSWHSADYAGSKFNLKVGDHQSIVRTWCNAMYDEAHSEMEASEEYQNYEKYIRYLMGHQWAGRRPKYRASPVDNRLWINMVQLVSYLTDTRQTFEVRAENTQHEKTAETLNKRNSAWVIQRDCDMTTAMICMYSAVCGVGYARQIWEPELDGGEGDIGMTACGPTEVIMIKPSYDIQAAQGLIYEKVMPLTWFRQRYPLYGDLVQSDAEYSSVKSAANLVTPGTMSNIPTDKQNPFESFLSGFRNKPKPSSAIPMGKYREFWLKDYQVNTSNADVYVGNMAKGTGYMVQPGQRLYPRGRLIIMGGDVVLYDGPNPHWHGRFPFAALRINQLPWTWYGVSELRNQIPLQDTMNNLMAGILDIIKRAVNPPAQSPTNAFSDSQKRSMDPNMPGLKAYYNPAAGINPLQYAPVPQLPPYVFQALNWAKAELSDQTGFIDMGAIAGKGLLPGADTLEALGQSQQTLVRLKVRYIEAFFREIGEQWIANAFQYYRTRRTLMSVGMDGLTWTDWTWDPQSLYPDPLNPSEHWRSFKWTILPGTMLKSQREPERAMAFQLRRLGDISRKHLYKILDMEATYDDVEKELEREGAQTIINMLRQKMSGMDGGGGINPALLQEVNNAVMEKPNIL